MRTGGDRARAFDRRLLAALFVLGLAARLAPMSAATAGGLRLLSPDCYGHLRRSFSVARHFPQVPTFDPTLDYPNGAVWIWAPSFDLLVGGAARALHGKGVTQDDVAWTGALVAPLLGALHVFPLFVFARRVLSRRRARIAVAAYAVMPGAVLWGCFGHVDHHVAEALVLLLFLVACARAVEAGLDARERARRAIVAGAALGLAVLTWHGAVFIAVLALPWAALALGPAAALLGGAAAATAALGTALVVGGKSLPFSFVSFGWFQPLFLAALTLPLALLALLRTRGRARLASAAASLVLAALVLPRASAMAGAVFRGSAYVVTEGRAAGADDYDHVHGGWLSYPPEFLRLVFEARPLLADREAALYAVRELSVGLVLLPIALALWTLAAWRSRARRSARLLLVVFAGAILVMTLFQRRSTYYLAAFTALALAEVLARLRLPRRLPRLLAPAAALALVVVPGISLLRSTAAYAQAPGRDFLDLMRRLRALAPPAAELVDLPPADAVTGVMAPWSAGHYVTALSGHPAAADPFAYGFRRQARLFTATDPAEVQDLLESSRCSWLVTTSIPDPVLAGYAEAVGRAGTPPSASVLRAVHASPSPRPLPFLSLALVSRSASKAPDGTLVPRFKVWRVAGR